MKNLEILFLVSIAQKFSLQILDLWIKLQNNSEQLINYALIASSELRSASHSDMTSVIISDYTVVCYRGFQPPY